MSPPKAILIAGPTASGKSALALALAERFGGIVINADSMQVYRELAILTARPDAGELARVPHKLYGHVPAAEPYSVGRWLEDMAVALGQTRAAGQMPVIVGGTGLYFAGLLEGLSPVLPIPPEVRVHWRAEAARLGPQRLHEELLARDPVMAARLRASDPQRVTRALEVITGTGRSLADWQRETGTPLIAKGEVLRLVLAPERETLYARCDARFEAMLVSGVLAEVASFSALGLPPDRPAMRATGRRELAAHLRGELTFAEAVAGAKTSTRQYAKRQMTWIRGRMADWTAIQAQEMQRASALVESFRAEASAPCGQSNAP